MVVAIVLKGFQRAESLARHQLVYLRTYADCNARVVFIHQDGLTAVDCCPLQETGGSRRRVNLTSIPMPSWDISHAKTKCGFDDVSSPIAEPGGLPGSPRRA